MGTITRCEKTYHADYHGPRCPECEEEARVTANQMRLSALIVLVGAVLAGLAGIAVGLAKMVALLVGV